MIRIGRNQKEVIKFIIMLVPIFEPKIFTQFSITTLLYIVFNIIEIFMLGIIITSSEKMRKVNWPIIIWGLYRLYILEIMCITQNFGGIMQWGYLSLMVTNLLLVFEYANYRGSIYKLLEAIAILGSTFLFINFITIMEFQRGIISADLYYMSDGDYYFLGIKTQFTTMMFPTIAAAGALFFNEKNKKNIFLFLTAVIVCLMNIFSKQISTPTVGIIIIIIGFGLGNVMKTVWKSTWLFLISLLLQLGIVFFNIQIYFSDFIANVLHKDTTLSARTNIWLSAKKILKEESLFRLIFGNGMNKLNTFVPYAGTYWQPHNQLLVWIHSSGIIGAVVIVLFLIKLTNKKIKNIKVQLFLVMICSVELFLSVTEVYFDVAICFVPYFVMFYITKHEQKYDNKIEKITNLQHFV